ncbi:MAG TPA: GNAT family N-acetyltransferase [Acidimicrobiia bacterium]|nr:GNAT family N-acetyltransferase [Acidimicrobiia bacterium]
MGGLAVIEVRTERLLLRRWKEEDRAPFAAMNADPAVMRYFPGTLTRKQSDALAHSIEQGWDERGFGLWAVEISGEVPFAGFVGLSVQSFIPVNPPPVEVGWRLGKEHWGKGYATEAGLASLRFGFAVGLDEIVSCTTEQNWPSRRVMERLGMTHDPDDDFDHPRLPADSTLRRHVLYRIERDQ